MPEVTFATSASDTFENLPDARSTPTSEDVIWSSNSIAASNSSRVLLFEGCGLLFALAAESVVEVIEPTDTHRIPGAPGWYCGVSVYRSRPVATIDIARFFLPESPQSDFNRAIVVRCAATHYLLAVEKILNLCKLPAASSKAANTHGMPEYVEHRAIKSTTQHDKRLLAVIDLPELLRCSKLLRECAVS